MKIVVGFWQGILTQADNRTFDPTYACILFVTFIVLPLSMVGILGISALDVYFNKHEFSAAAVGAGIAAVIVAIGGYLAAAAAFINQDRKPGAPSKTVTSSSTEEITTKT